MGAVILFFTRLKAAEVFAECRVDAQLFASSPAYSSEEQ
jgi:hypothetical protein